MGSLILNKVTEYERLNERQGVGMLQLTRYQKLTPGSSVAHDGLHMITAIRAVHKHGDKTFVEVDLVRETA